MLPVSIEKLHSIYKSCKNIVCTDTRNIIPTSLFICLKGANFNGNEFASEALKKGASFVLSDEEKYITDNRILYCHDALETLQQLALYHRLSIKTHILAIGGSNGKTTTKELCCSVLETEKKVKATKGNFNNHIGVPLTLLALDGTEDIGIVELGTNHPGEMKVLCDISKANSGIVTNVGKEHLEGFGSIEAIAREESELYLSLLANNGQTLVNTDDTWLSNMANRLQNKFTFGINAKSDLQGTVVNSMPFLTFQLTYKSKNYGPYTAQLGGDYNLYNILAAISTGILFGIDIEKCAVAACQYRPSNNRSEWLEKSGKSVLLDAYNANPSSMEVTLRSFAKITGDKTVILGDMLELGESASDEHNAIVDLALKLGFNQILLAGTEFSQVAKNQPKTVSFENTDALLHWMRQHPVTSQFVLIKGSRGMKMEKSIEFL